MKSFFDSLEVALSSFAARVLLSVLIIASLVPREISPGTAAVFLFVFGCEALMRSTLLLRAIRFKKVTLLQCLVLGVDILATTSFLPAMLESGQILRIGRIARLLLLLAYWGPLFRDFFRIALQRERLSQMVLIGGLAALLSGIGAGVLRVLNATGVDINGDGLADGPTGNIPFVDLLWWTFQQVEDPGNLVQSTSNTGILLLSLGLTASGLLLVAFIIGVGTTLVEDLIKASLQRNVRLTQHTVVLNISDETHGLLNQIVHYFRKQVRWRKVALLGSTPERPAFLYGRTFRSFRYRHGKATDLLALKRLDIHTARRVAILADPASKDSDATVVTATLSARQLSKTAWIVAELQNPTNIKTALTAGQAHTLPVPATRLASLVLSQALLDPSRALLFEDLVSLSGQELYTAILGDGLLSDLPEETLLPGSFRQLREQVYHDHNCLLIGYIQDHQSGPCTWLWGLDPILDLSADPSGPIRGLIGIAERFENLHQATRSLFQAAKPPLVRSPSLSIKTPLVAPAAPLQRLLVLGFNPEAGEALGEIMILFPGCEITIACPTPTHLNRTSDGLRGDRLNGGRTFNAQGERRFTLSPSPKDNTSHIILKSVKPNDDALFDENTGGNLDVGSVYDYDGLFFLAGSSGERDSTTVLGLLKLLEGWKRPDVRLNRVIVEIFDPAKSALVRPKVAAHPLAPRFTLVQTQQLRHQILNHSLFAPGLSPVLYNLLTSSPQTLETLSLQDHSGPFTFDQLIRSLGDLTPPRLPIALVDPDGEVVVNPSRHRSLQFEHCSAVHCITGPN